jgi:DNA primase catalytic subunit
VSTKKKSAKAYSIGSGEFVVDVDAYLNHKPHGHRTRNNESCHGCLENAKELTQRVLEVLEENYRDIRVVFSGRAGFHCHVLDFNVEDWTTLNEKNPLKSHEVGRFKFVLHISERVPEAFDRSHFILSCDTMRVITVPESLNALTGLKASYLGTSHDFFFMEVKEILRDARSAKAPIAGLGWTKASNLEIRPLASQLDSNHVFGSDVSA